MTAQQPAPPATSPDDSHVGFVGRHIGINADERLKMLAELGFANISDLIDAAVPASVRSASGSALPPAASESTVLAELRGLAALNEPGEAMIGLGYYGTLTPGVIRRNVLENPAWYTAYTPYQPEISQGRLETLLNFQTMVGDLTALPTANASLLDEATAVAEAIAVMRRSVRGQTKTGFCSTWNACRRRLR